MGIHRIYVVGPLSEGPVQVEGDEARHAARAKRLEMGERVEVLDGRGGVGRGVVVEVRKGRDGWVVGVNVEGVDRAEPPRPRVEVCSAVPGGARLSEMIDGLAQVGAAAWRALDTERGERQNWRRDKLERVAVEASKQSGRAWTMEIGEAVQMKEAVHDAGWDVVMADAGGERYEARGERVRLLVGPEGGWSAGEVERARRAGARVCRFGVHAMRIETAAVVAAGVVMGADEKVRR